MKEYRCKGTLPSGRKCTKLLFKQKKELTSHTIFEDLAGLRKVFKKVRIYHAENDKTIPMNIEIETKCPKCKHQNTFVFYNKDLK
ncbi:unnamed protein product [marine sediment metagenome]|uniref:Uncharacterized protein n=1 Tax=marine sediment metagenome TaxID=412755 RepID=X0RP01_9ZZZZ